MLIYFATQGEIHGSQYFPVHGKSRLANTIYIKREHAWALFGFSSAAVYFFIYPALHFLLGRRDGKIPKSAR